MEVAPPSLEAGDYALAAYAVDAACRVIGRGCVAVSIPYTGANPLVVEIDSVSPEALCAPADCTDGICAGAADAGPSDSGPAPMLDAGPPDSGVVCPSGFGDCNHAPSDGCETPLNTLADCGGCNRSCTPSHATGDCGARVCTIASCADGWADCNGRSDDGCETNTASDVDNCGSCGGACRLPHASGTCMGGSCGTTMHELRFRVRRLQRRPQRRL